MSLDDLVSLDISIANSSVSVPGFGIPLIAAVHALYAERLRYYTNPAVDMLTDGFLTTDQVYKEAVAAMSQRPSPSKVAIGRRVTPVAMQQLLVIPASPQATTLYRVVVNGVNCDYTTDGSATQAELRDGLIAAINNSTQGAVVTAAAATNDVNITSDVAGVPFTVTIASGPTPAITFPAQTKLFTTPAAPNNSTLYRLIINGTNCDFTTDGTATQAELRDGMIAAINNAVGAAVTATASGTDVLVTADVAGTNFSWEIYSLPATNPFASGAATGHVPNVGLANDLAAITAEQPDWYCLLLPDRDEPTIVYAASIIEAQRRKFAAQSSQAAILNLPYNPANTLTDVASRLRGLGYTRTSLWYHPTDTDTLASAVVGRCLPETPGSITWMFKELAGVTATQLTATQQTNLLSKNANGYRSEAGRKLTYEGKVASGEYIDVIHGIDKLYSRIQVLIFAAMLTAPKIPYVQSGIATISSCVRTALKESTRDGLIAESRTLANGDIESPAFTVSPPKIGDISSVDRATRAIPAGNPIRFEATLAGAIHAVNISGTVSV